MCLILVVGGLRALVVMCRSEENVLGVRGRAGLVAYGESARIPGGPRLKVRRVSPGLACHLKG